MRVPEAEALAVAPQVRRVAHPQTAVQRAVLLERVVRPAVQPVGMQAPQDPAARARQAATVAGAVV